MKGSIRVEVLTRDWQPIPGFIEPQARAIQELTWLGAGEEIAAFAVFALIAWWIAGRMRVQATVGAGLSLARPLR